VRRRAVCIDERARQQCDLVRAQNRELAEVEARWDAQAVDLAKRRAEGLAELKASHVRQLVDLWVKQRREIGPWTAPVLEGELPRAFPREGKVGHG
jgi:hypothetical protein